MNIKWGWLSLGSLLVGFIAPILIGIHSIISSSVLTIFSFLSLSFGIVTIIKRDTESKTSFIIGITSLVLSLLLLILIIHADFFRPYYYVSVALNSNS